MTQNISRFKCFKTLLCLQWENLMKRLSVYFQVNDPGVCLTGNSRFLLNNSKIPIIKTFVQKSLGLLSAEGLFLDRARRAHYWKEVCAFQYCFSLYLDRILHQQHLRCVKQDTLNIIKLSTKQFVRSFIYI